MVISRFVGGWMVLSLFNAALGAAQPELPQIAPPPIPQQELPTAPPPPAVDTVPEHEITRLLRGVQDQIELDSRLGGALLIQGVCLPTDEALCRLAIRGQIAAADQVPLINELIQATMANDEFWSSVREQLTLDLDTLIVIPPSAARASRYYGIALNEFFHGDYATADFAFARAVAEEPQSVVFRYWRVLTAIALGEYERAERKLEPLLAAEPFGSKQTLVADALERVQGPLRWKLAELEEHVLLYRLP